MASGTPVIVSNASTLPEVVGTGGITVDPSDVDGLREQLLRLTEDEAYWDRMRSLALQQSANFSWARCASNTLAVYRRVLKQ
jgi:alpha-1,3-rhamnosyl/mannosyltransferase